MAGDVTQPPSRYTEGSLIEALEERGIGRPSTYAEIVSRATTRDYVVKRGRELAPTKLGTAKTRGLVARFPAVMDYAFSAKVERDLDEVEAGRRDWVTLVDAIYRPFKRSVEEEMASTEPGDAWPRVAPSGRVCDQCGAPMVRRWSPHDDYDACAAYPACKHIIDDRPREPPEVFAERRCPRCGRELLIKKRRGAEGEFLSCSGWKKSRADCEYVAPLPSGRRDPSSRLNSG